MMPLAVVAAVVPAVGGDPVGSVVDGGTVACGKVAGVVLIELLEHAVLIAMTSGRARARTVERVMVYSAQFRAVHSS